MMEILVQGLKLLHSELNPEFICPGKNPDTYG